MWPLVPASDWLLTVHDWHEHSNRPIRGTLRNLTIRVINMELLASNLRPERFEPVQCLHATSGLELLCVNSYRHLWFNFQGESPLKAFHNGDRVQVKILGFRDTKTHKYVHGLRLFFSDLDILSCITRLR